ncbi:MAG TPA: transcriptional regulator [Stellaceae bacterium]|nr:transcriptional regulator [Stellaceae bacterium]
MAAPNDVIHQSMRLKIMAALNVLNADAQLDFGRLRALVGATDGNLGAHLETLEKAGYVAIEKLFVGKKPQTRVRATPSGRHAFGEHVAYLRHILNGTGERPS